MKRSTTTTAGAGVATANNDGKSGKTRVRRRKKRTTTSSSIKYENAVIPSIVVLAFTALVVVARLLRGAPSSPSDVGGLSESAARRVAPVEVVRRGRSSSRANQEAPRHDDDGVAAAADRAVSSPVYKWPVSIRDEDGDFEEVVHPGDGKTIMSFPRYWSPPIAGEDGTVGSLMSRDAATGFGSYVDGARDTDWKQKGDPNKRTIFVAVASYRDWQCRYTVESILNTAAFPDRVRVVVVDQIHEGDPSCGVPIKPCEDDPEQALCKHIDRVDVIEIEAQLALGPVFARYIGHRLYRGEYYAMQVDAHVTFVKNWDTDIIQQMESTNNEMAVISTYLTDIEGSINARTGLSNRNTRPIMCNTDFEGGGASRHLRHNSQPEVPPKIQGSPQMQPYWAAGWSFARGHFVVNVPYDLYLPMVFMGEESSIGVRAFTFGYDHYAAERSICFHTYAVGKNAKARGKVKHFWENTRNYAGKETSAMKRLLGIIGMNQDVDPSEWDHSEEKLYGIGHARKLSDFYDTFGIHVKTKTVEQHLCRFVQTGNMHRKFLPFLRKNEMGLDYTKIHYKFEDPMK